MGSNEFYSLLVAIGGTIVLPCVLLFLWLMQRERNRRPAEVESAAFAQLAETARRLESRIDYLEAMLDADVPGWRASRLKGS